MNKKEQLWINGWNNDIHAKRVFTIKLFKYRLELWKDFYLPKPQPGTLNHNGCHYHMKYFIACKDCQERYPQLAKKLAKSKIKDNTKNY